MCVVFIVIIGFIALGVSFRREGCLVRVVLLPNVLQRLLPFTVVADADKAI